MIPCESLGAMVADLRFNAFDRVPVEHAKDSIIVMKGSTQGAVKIPQGLVGMLVKKNRIQGTQTGDYFRKSGSVTLDSRDFLVLAGENRVPAINRAIQNGGLYLYHSPGMTLAFFNEAVPNLQDMNDQMAEKARRNDTSSADSTGHKEEPPLPPPLSQSPDQWNPDIFQIHKKLDDLTRMVQTAIFELRMLCIIFIVLNLFLCLIYIRSVRTDKSIEARRPRKRSPKAAEDIEL